jgi:Membrane protein of 12 TMs
VAAVKLVEAWKLSRVPYVELVYRSAVMARGTTGGRGGFSSNPTSRVKAIIRGAVISKAIITLFIGVGTVLAFAQYGSDKGAPALVSGVTFSLAIGLAYLVLYSLQVLPSFSTGGPYSLLSTLPIGTRDLSLVTLLSVIRTFDSIIVASVSIQVIAVAYLTGSVIATAVMFLAAIANSVFGVAVSLGLAGVFQRNISRGGRGKAAGAARFVFLISWALAAASLGFLFNLVNYVFPALESAISGSLASTTVPIIFSLLHPFWVGLVLASVVYPSFAHSQALQYASTLSFVAMAGYLVLAYFAAKKALGITVAVSRGSTVSIARQRATEFILRLRRPISAYVLKDARVASKNPSTAIVFALPVIETAIVAFNLAGAGEIRAMAILTSTGLGCFFTLISASVLLNTEGTGLDYTLSLPLSARVIVMAKSAIATVAYTPVPAAIGVLLLLYKPASIWLLLVPLTQVIAVSAATSAELSFFIQSYRKRGEKQTSRSVETRGLNFMSVGDLLRFVAALLVGGGLTLAPLIAYVVAFLVQRSDFLAVGLMGGVALAEFSVVQLYLRR